jgi:anthranilate phosphoribosyltransferase
MPNIGELTLAPAQEFDFRLLIKALGKGEKGSRSLTFAEARLLLEGFASGHATRVQMASAMMLMRVRGETLEEVAGMVSGLRRSVAKGWQSLTVDIDWPVYAGKREQLPWLLLVAKLLASQGVRVMLHGDSKALPHRRHVESCIAALNIRCCSTPQSAQEALNVDHIVYVCAGDLAPVLDECRQLHQELGLRSLIQTAARCINPCNAPLSLRSYFHPGLDNLHQQLCETLLANGDYPAGHVAIFKGLQGETEFNPRVATNVTVVGNPLGYVEVLSFTLPTLLEGFSGAKVGQAELSSEILALLWREPQPFLSTEMNRLMSRTMIEQALSSVNATLAAVLLLLDQHAKMATNVVQALNVERAIQLGQECWQHRFCTSNHPLVRWHNKERLCVV